MLHLVVSLQLNAAYKIFICPSGLFVADLADWSAWHHANFGLFGSGFSHQRAT
jgi:hypothetical protein